MWDPFARRLSSAIYFSWIGRHSFMVRHFETGRKVDALSSETSNVGVRPNLDVRVRITAWRGDSSAQEKILSVEIAGAPSTATAIRIIVPRASGAVTLTLTPAIVRQRAADPWSLFPQNLKVAHGSFAIAVRRAALNGKTKPFRRIISRS